MLWKVLGIGCCGRCWVRARKRWQGLWSRPSQASLTLLAFLPPFSNGTLVRKLPHPSYDETLVGSSRTWSKDSSRSCAMQMSGWPAARTYLAGSLFPKPYTGCAHGHVHVTIGPHAEAMHARLPCAAPDLKVPQPQRVVHVLHCKHCALGMACKLVGILCMRGQDAWHEAPVGLAPN